MTPEIASLISKLKTAEHRVILAENKLILALNIHHDLIGKIALNDENKPFVIEVVAYNYKTMTPIRIGGRLIISKRRTQCLAPFKFQEPST